MNVEPVTLEGPHVRLEPVGLRHLDGLWHAGRFPEAWRMRPSPGYSREELAAQVRAAIAAADAGLRFMVATLDVGSGRPFGTTSLSNIDAEHRRLEIGGTGVTPAWPRSPVNTEAKVPAAAALLRDARLPPSRVQDRRPQRRLASRAGPHRRGRGGQVPPPHGPARRGRA